MSEALTAFAHSAATLATTRFMLGLGEPGLWVAAPKAVGEFFEKEKRASAIGSHTLGATAGAVVALPVIVAVTTHLPWRSIFLLDGFTGLLWLPLWFLCLRGRGGRESVPSRQNSSISPINITESDSRRGLRAVLSVRRTWQLLVARALTDPVQYFYFFWFPKYLASTQHLTLQQVARTGWCVYLGAGAGTLLGGFIAGAWIRRGDKPVLAYRKTMVFSALLVPLSPLATLHGNTALKIAIGAVVLLAHMSWLVNLHVLGRRPISTLASRDRCGTYRNWKRHGRYGLQRNHRLCRDAPWILSIVLDDGMCTSSGACRDVDFSKT